MSESWFVRPETVRLPVSGQELIVRRRLTNGEQRAMFARMYETGATPIRVNTLQTGIALIVAYLVDWTLVDETGSKVEIRGLPVDDLATIIDNLAPDRFTAIKEAIERHVAAEDEAREELKKTETGALEPSPT